MNYTADLKTRVEPCVFSGNPNCAECGCSISMGLHWLGEMKIAGLLRVRHFINGSLAVGITVNRALDQRHELRWGTEPPVPASEDLIQIQH